MCIRCLDLISVLPDEEVQKGIGDPQAVRIDAAPPIVVAALQVIR